MKNATDEVVGQNDKVFKNYEDFEENLSSPLPPDVCCSNPGTNNGLAVAVIDHGADFQISLKNTGTVTEATGASVTDGTDFGTAAAGDTVAEYINNKATGTATISAGDKVVA